MKKSITATLLSFSLMFVSLFADDEPEQALGELLRDALFAEEADRDLAKAEASYREIIGRFDDERAYAATAILRLAELLHGRGDKEEAEKWFARVLQEFPDQEAVAKVARARLGDKAAKLVGAEAAGKRPLSAAEQELEKVRKLVAESPDLLDSPDEAGWTPLALAADSGEAKVVAFLLDQGVQIDGGPKKKSPIAEALNGGHLSVVRQLIDAGAKLPAELLQITARSGNYAATKLLLAGGADPNIPNVFSLYPEGFRDGRSVKRANSPYARPRQNDENSRLRDLWTPLEIAMFFRYPKLTELLLENGAVPTDRPATIYGGAHRPSHALRFAIIDDNHELVAKLLEAGADPDSRWENVPALMIAGQLEDARITKLLLAAGADPDSRDQSGATALFSANSEAMPALIAAGADVNAKNNTGMRPIHSFRDVERIKILLAAGAEVDAATDRGWTALFNASPDAADLLIAAGANVSHSGAAGTVLGILATQTREDAPEVIEKLVKAGADPDQIDANGSTPLEHAVKLGIMPNVKSLLEHGADPNGAEDTIPPLLVVPDHEPDNGAVFDELVQLLVDAGADPNVQDATGQTALSRAVKRDREQLADYLIEKGSSLYYGKGLVYQAAAGQSTKVASKLFRLAYLQDDLRAGAIRITIPKSTRVVSAIIAETEAGEPLADCPYTLLEAFGFTSADASLPIRKILIWRAGQDEPMPIDLRELISARDPARDVPLKWGDVIEFDHAISPQDYGIPAEERDFLTQYLTRNIRIEWFDPTNPSPLPRPAEAKLEWLELPGGKRWQVKNNNSIVNVEMGSEEKLILSSYRPANIRWQSNGHRQPSNWAIRHEGEVAQDPLSIVTNISYDPVWLKNNDTLLLIGASIARPPAPTRPPVPTSSRRVVLPPKTR